MPPLRSTSLSAAEYDPTTQELTITFRNGQSYSYPDVPEEVYQGLMKAPSPGVFFWANIKDVY